MTQAFALPAGWGGSALVPPAPVASLIPSPPATPLTPRGRVPPPLGWTPRPSSPEAEAAAEAALYREDRASHDLEEADYHAAQDKRMPPEAARAVSTIDIGLSVAQTL